MAQIAPGRPPRQRVLFGVTRLSAPRRPAGGTSRSPCGPRPGGCTPARRTPGCRPSPVLAPCAVGRADHIAQETRRTCRGWRARRIPSARRSLFLARRALAGTADQGDFHGLDAGGGEGIAGPSPAHDSQAAGPLTLAKVPCRTRGADSSTLDVLPAWRPRGLRRYGGATLTSAKLGTWEANPGAPGPMTGGPLMAALSIRGEHH
jgi:hypothetical protein